MPVNVYWRRSIDRTTTIGANVVALLLTWPLLIFGCRRGPAAVHVPAINPVAASQQAIELYDANHDGVLSQSEIAACPGILGHLSAYDTNGDGSVSQQEIEARLRELTSARVGLTNLRVRVRLDGRPLAGAQIKLVPEKYLGSEVKAAWGKTNERGTAIVDIRDDDSPPSERGLIGVHYGTYKVEATHPSVAIPAKYNTQTTLGYETEVGNPQFVIDLKSR